MVARKDIACIRRAIGAYRVKEGGWWSIVMDDEVCIGFALKHKA